MKYSIRPVLLPKIQCNTWLEVQQTIAKSQFDHATLIWCDGSVLCAIGDLKYAWAHHNTDHVTRRQLRDYLEISHKDERRTK